MPIYEFLCNHCQTEFDKLVSYNWKDAGVSCPICGSTELERVVSRVCSRTGGSGMSANDLQSVTSGGGHSCSSCSGGTCSTCH